MADLTFTTNNQIIRDLYNTPDEAIKASKKLGCSGYRVYIINGESKYVPCSSFVQYEKALRYTILQGKVGAFGSDTFGDKLVGLQFANSKSEIQGDPFFTLGNFGIEKSVNYSEVQQRQAETPKSAQNNAVKSFTVEDIANRNLSYFKGKEYVSTLQARVDEKIKVKVLFDKRKLDKYVLYSSLKERIKNSLIEIYNNYPAAIKAQAVSISIPTVTNYITYSLENRSDFKVNLYTLSNPFNIEYTVNGKTLTDSETVTKYRNFSKTFKDYVIYYNGVEYPIINAKLPTNINDDITGIFLSVQGDPFSSVATYSSGNANINFFIKPKSSVVKLFYDNLTDLSSFLLNVDDNGNFVSEFIFPKLADNGITSNVKEIIYFPTYDIFNIDMFSDKFDKYTTKLNDIADSYDTIKTKLIARFLTTDSLKEYDTEDRKFNLLLELYGRTFDEVKKYIDGITFMRNVSYNKIENVPDLLIKNYATMLGFKTYEIQDEDTLIASLFDFNNTTLEKSTTPAEIDIELWRRILINSFYLYKSKGTRKSIEFILKLVGLPDDIFDLNEYIYVAERKLDVLDSLNKIYQTSTIDDPTQLLQNVPFDINGFPTVPIGIHFQQNGGYLYEDKYNVGEFDFGKTYINAYKKFNNVFLFDLQRTVDNVKSWVYSTEITDHVSDIRNGYTEYTIDHSDLAINSKEFEVYLGSNRIQDLSIYRQYVRNIGVVNIDLNIDDSLKFDAKDVSFNVFLKKCLDNFINPKNRKTIKVYPTLSKVYFDYLASLGNPMTTMRTLEFLNKFDTSWVKLIEQFVPATTIINAGNKIQNSIFLDNKHIYKHGLNNDVEWLGTDGSEFQQKALKPVMSGAINPIENVGIIGETKQGTIEPYIIQAKLGARISGTDPTVNEYFGVYYTMFDYCDESEGSFYLWESGIDYADVTYGGNINTPGTGATRYGVFVFYNDNLYRLNTWTLFGKNQEIHTDTSFAAYPPNSAYIVSGGTEYKIWDKISLDADSRTITFSDYIGGIGYTISDELRSFFMNSIGRGLAYVRIQIDYDCPPPKPHVCYYNMTGVTIGSISPIIHATYIDEFGSSLTLNQPKYYGYSKNMDGLKSIGVLYGNKYNWTIPYKKRFSWVVGKIYYQGEIIANNSLTDFTKTVSASNIYIVTSSTVTGTSSYPISVIDGLALIGTESSTTTGTTGGLYETYDERTRTDPFMHIDPAYISYIELDPKIDKYSINLTQSLKLLHIFSGATPQTTFRVADNVVNNELFISDSISLIFDGLYPIDSTKIGPFYTTNDEEIFTHTLNDRLELIADKDNYVSIESLNNNFVTIGDDLTLGSSNPGYYKIIKNSYLNFNFNLYFESVLNTEQSVNIKLIGSSGIIYDVQMISFTGSDDASLRERLYQYSGFFNAGEKIYLVIEPITQNCTLSRYEKIEYLHDDPNETDYVKLNDPRFRVFFNTGNVQNGYFDEGFSIKPIYNDLNLDTSNLILNTADGKYNNIPLVNVKYNTEPSYLFNKLFKPYYDKFAPTEFISDVTSYDKNINFDKISFTLKVRSKNSNIPANSITIINNRSINVGFETSDFEKDLTFIDYHLGNTIKITENSDVTNSISIGKIISKRLSDHTRTINYIPKYSFYNEVAMGTGATITGVIFQSQNSGLKDSLGLDYSNNILNEIKSKRRYVSTTGTTTGFYALENAVYDTEIYKAILNVVPQFNSQVINYNLNDIVKVSVGNYKKVVSGNTIQIETVDKLYVCINEIHTEHCIKYYDATTSATTISEIHEIYQPRGSRSCFIEIEKYNTTNFTPWGYEDLKSFNTPNTNLYDYINKKEVAYGTTGYTDWQLGDILISKVTGSTTVPTEYYDEYFKYVYPKNVIWVSGQTYQAGEFVYYPTGNTNTYRFYVARTRNTNSTPSGSTANWRILPSPLIFDHKSIGTYGGALDGLIDGVYESASHPGIPDPTVNLNYCSTAVRLPKTLVLSLNGSIMPQINNNGTGTAGTSGTAGRWNKILQPLKHFTDTAYTYLSNGEVINTYNLYRSAAAGFPGTSGIYTGITTGYGTGTSVTDNYNDVNGTSRYGITNLYIKPSENSTTYFTHPRANEARGIYPLFERLCLTTERNNPKNWFITDSIYNSVSGTTYTGTTLYMGNKYVVNRGVLYKYVGTGFTVTTGGIQPYADIDNWIERDFCLVNNFTFYKDRTKVTVFESTINSLTDDVKNSLYMFKSNHELKTGFTNRSFIGSGTTDNNINNMLMTGLNKFYDVTDSNRISVEQQGTADFRQVGNDIWMDYYVDKDVVGYPLTGEFMGKLKISNPCGHVATTIFGLLFDTDVTKLDRQIMFSPNLVTVPQTAETFSYIVNVVVGTTAQASSSLLITTSDLNSIDTTTTTYNVTTKGFNKSLNVNPGTNLVISISYDTKSKQTQFKSAKLDNLDLYVKNVTVDNNFLKTELSTSAQIETRTITIKGVTSNATLVINLKGIEDGTTTNILNSSIYDVSKINIKNVGL